MFCLEMAQCPRPIFKVRESRYIETNLMAPGKTQTHGSPGKSTTDAQSQTHSPRTTCFFPNLDLDGAQSLYGSQLSATETNTEIINL